MSELSHRARVFVQANRAALRPDLADRARVLEGLLKRLEVNHDGAEHRTMPPPSRVIQHDGLAASKA